MHQTRCHAWYSAQTHPTARGGFLLGLMLAWGAPEAATAADAGSVAVSAAKPVKVYILSGQSNMFGMAQVDGESIRWGSEFIDPVLSVYPED